MSCTQSAMNILVLDITAATILDRFQNQNTASAVERVLKSLSATKAKEILDVSLNILLV
jgi:hypothetical protein